MENIIVATFNDEARAIEGMHKMSELEHEGDISVYNKILIRKGANGEYEVLKDENLNGWLTVAGMAFGGLIGGFGGPLGVAVGLYAGTVVGSIIDYTHYVFEQDFINTMSKDIPPGSVSIIAELDESNSVFIDENFKTLGAVIFRSNVYEEHDKFVERKMNALDSEIQTAETEFALAAEEQKADITAKVEELRRSRNAKIAEIEMKSKESLHELKAKMEENKAKLETRFAKIQNEVSDKINSVRLERAKQKLAEYELKIEELNKKLAGFKQTQSA
jgi:uncharacterized membrane protein